MFTPAEFGLRPLRRRPELLAGSGSEELRCDGIGFANVSKIRHPLRKTKKVFMPQSPETNPRIVLNSRPHGAPKPENFRLETTELPEPADGQLLLRTVYLSLDPYLRGRMSDSPSYAPPVEVGEVMIGGSGCRVQQSRHPDFVDWVLANTGWQDYAVTSGEGLIPLGQQLEHPSRLLGVLGMPGFTA